MLFDVGVHFHKLYGVVNLDLMVSNVGLMTKMNGYEIDMPSAFNVGFNNKPNFLINKLFNPPLERISKVFPRRNL